MTQYRLTWNIEVVPGWHGPYVVWSNEARRLALRRTRDDGTEVWAVLYDNVYGHLPPGASVVIRHAGWSVPMDVELYDAQKHELAS